MYTVPMTTAPHKTSTPSHDTSPAVPWAVRPSSTIATIPPTDSHAPSQPLRGSRSRRNTRAATPVSTGMIEMMIEVSTAEVRAMPSVSRKKYSPGYTTEAPSRTPNRFQLSRSRPLSATIPRRIAAARRNRAARTVKTLKPPSVRA